MGVTIAEMRRRVAAALKSTLFQESINETAVALENVNRQHLDYGFNALGIKIGSYQPYRDDVYARAKNTKNPNPGLFNPDLYSSGSFYEKIKVTVSARKLTWSDSDVKARDLLAKYGSVLGVFESNALQQYRERFLWPIIIRKFKLQTGIK